MSHKATICGVGIKDLGYFTQRHEKINGKWKNVWTCHFYRIWSHMIKRCYSPREQTKQPTYIGCSVHSNWLYLSNFKAWMENQDYVGKELDKDLLFPGNKLYSENTCVFISHKLNTFLIDCGASRGKFPIGVTVEGRKTKVFKSRCSNPFTNSSEYLGCFKTPEEAHLAWKKRKHELACQFADLETDLRIQKALRERFL